MKITTRVISICVSVPALFAMAACLWFAPAARDLIASSNRPKK
jgi:hypothetical protein